MRIVDLKSLEASHLLGPTLGPLVQLNIISDDVMISGQMQPEQAREFALDILASAARAEYEGDWVAEADNGGMDKDMIATGVIMVRRGEIIRVRRELGEQGQTDQ